VGEEAVEVGVVTWGKNRSLTCSLDFRPEHVNPIPGMPPELGDLPDGCAFAARCDRAIGTCAALPSMTDGLACHHPHVPEEDRA
jgi:ABC-type dipeptide/oligopeptide/nickel transport system ATPase component